MQIKVETSLEFKKHYSNSFIAMKKLLLFFFKLSIFIFWMVNPKLEVSE